MTINKALETRVRGEDVMDLLDHIAWTNTLKPKLLDVRKQYQEALVTATLGGKASPLTPIELAGRCYGITYIVQLIEDLLKNTEEASKIIAKEMAR